MFLGNAFQISTCTRGWPGNLAGFTTELQALITFKDNNAVAHQVKFRKSTHISPLCVFSQCIRKITYWVFIKMLEIVSKGFKQSKAIVTQPQLGYALSIFANKSFSVLCY